MPRAVHPCEFEPRARNRSPRRASLLLATAMLAASCGGGPPPPAAPPGRAEPVVEHPAAATEPAARDDDGDTIPDATDGCPDAAEDLDYFEDGDGCPDPDNDDDRIDDGDDECPNEPETYNGRDDEDGCPDELLVVITGDPPPRGPERVRFGKGSARVRESEQDLLRMVADVLADNPQLERLLVVGLAARDEGASGTRVRLSLRRAEAVVEFLVQAGVAGERLRAVGYGDLCSFDPGESEEARDRNRAVTFTIVRSSGTCTRDDGACPAAHEAGLVPADDCVDAPGE
ncbi:MAG: OmpA family protein [Deltaproteobacteria bacterium]|nr:OmpA family protein [Deltaproteobacteria bacterium]